MEILPDGRIGLLLYFGILAAVGMAYVTFMPALLMELAIYDFPALFLFGLGGILIAHGMYKIFRPFGSDAG